MARDLKSYGNAADSGERIRVFAMVMVTDQDFVRTWPDPAFASSMFSLLQYDVRRRVENQEAALGVYRFEVSLDEWETFYSRHKPPARSRT